MRLVAASSARALVEALANAADPLSAETLKQIEQAVRKRRVLDSMQYAVPVLQSSGGTTSVSRGELLAAISECRVEDLEVVATKVGVSLRARRRHCACCGRHTRSPKRRGDMPVAALTVAAVPALGAV